MALPCGALVRSPRGIIGLVLLLLLLARSLKHAFQSSLDDLLPTSPWSWQDDEPLIAAVAAAPSNETTILLERITVNDKNQQQQECYKLHRKKKNLLIVQRRSESSTDTEYYLNHQEQHGANLEYATAWNYSLALVSNTTSLEEILLQNQYYDAIMVLGLSTRIALLHVDVGGLLLSALQIGRKKNKTAVMVGIMESGKSFYTGTSIWDMQRPLLKEMITTARNNNNNNNNSSASGALEATVLQHHVQEFRDLSAPLIVTASSPRDRRRSKEEAPAQHSSSSCALLFFGLPKCFKRLVLPSIRRNILANNPTCKIFVHSFDVPYVSSRRNGENHTLLHVDEIRELIVDDDSEESLLLLMESLDGFEERYNLTDLRDKYYPKGSQASQWDYPTSFDNMIKQWHSIESVWNLMEQYMASRTTNTNASSLSFDRVGLFRSDVLYVTPIANIMMDENDAVIPWFSPQPRNDRMFYGSFENAKIWATKRFSSIPHALQEGHLSNGLHPERYLKSTIFPQMTGPSFVEKDICFLRVRATGRIRATDCYCNRHYQNSPHVVERIVRGYREFVTCNSIQNIHLDRAISCMTNLQCAYEQNDDESAPPNQYITCSSNPS